MIIRDIPVFITFGLVLVAGLIAIPTMKHAVESVSVHSKVLHSGGENETALATYYTFRR